MIIHTVLKKGIDHPTFCEDFLSIKETKNFLFLSIFDGCSGGKDCHFASSLFGKVFNEIISNFSSIIDKKEDSIKDKSKFIIYMISQKIKEIKQSLNLNVIELLSTIVICLINKKTNQCIVVSFGDGYFFVDGTEVVIKNNRFIDKENGNNMPDYLVYDLDKIKNYEDFDVLFTSKPEIHEFENVKNISISSDGINTFRNFKKTENMINPIDFLIKDEWLMNTPNMLERKYNILQNKYYMINTDDISIIRVKF